MSSCNGGDDGALAMRRTDNLVAELAFTTKLQLASWSPGAARLAVAVVKPGQNPAALIVGQ